MKPEPGRGIVAISAMVRAGAAQESIQTAGLGNFVAQLLLASTRLSSAEKIAAIADEVGGNIAAQWTQDFTEIRAVTTAANYNRAMSLIGECLTEANFESRWVELVRESLLQQRQAGSDDISQNAYNDLRTMLYEDNGYKRPSLGSERVIRLATPKDLQTFYSRYYVPNNTVICVVGDVTVEHALDRVRKAYAGVRARKLPIDRGVPDEELDHSKFQASEADLPLAYLVVGWLAPGVQSQDFPALLVAANALGGGKGSFMFQELRQKRGIAYDLGIMYPRFKYQSHLIARILTDPFKTSLPGLNPEPMLQEIKNALLAQVDRLKRETLAADELERAKGFTIGTHALQHQHIADRAFHLAWMEAIGVGFEYDSSFADAVEKISAADVQRAANKYLTNYAALLLLPRVESPESVEESQY